MARQQPVIIEEEREPSYWNRHVFTGAKLGLLAALGVTAALALTGGLAAAPWLVAALSGGAGLLIGAGSAAGCIHGKEEIARNREEGRVVNPPGLLNEGMLHGLLNGGMLTLAALTATGLATGGTGFGVAAALVAGLGVGTTGLLGYYQGRQHQDVMQAEYEQAARHAHRREEGVLRQLMNAMGKDKSQARGQEQGVTPDESARLESRLRDGTNRRTDWREAISGRDMTGPERSA